MAPGFTIYSGETVHARILAGRYVELCFERNDAAINKLDRLAIQEMADALEAMTDVQGLRGVLITSAKATFIVGADIAEFPRMFRLSDAEMTAVFRKANEVMNALEDLPVPTVAAINGFALGGGLELALAADFRMMSAHAKVGLPEVTLGIFPGFGGTVRMPRVAGIEAAIDWIAGGAQHTAEQAFAVGVVEAVVPAEELRERSLDLLDKAAAGQCCWRARRAIKLEPMRELEQHRSLILNARETLDSRPEQQHESAASAALLLMSNSIGLEREPALSLETARFVQVAKTQAAQSLVQAFLNERLLKRKSRMAAQPV